MTNPAIAPITPTDAAPTIAHRAGCGKSRSDAAIVFTTSFSPTPQGPTALRTPIVLRDTAIRELHAGDQVHERHGERV